MDIGLLRYFTVNGKQIDIGFLRYFIIDSFHYTQMDIGLLRYFIIDCKKINILPRLDILQRHFTEIANI